MNEYVRQDIRPENVFSDDNAMFRSEVFAVVSSVREELDDHRQAINENTNEVESNFEFLAEIARKVDALSERLDMLSLTMGSQKSEPLFQVASLSTKEKKVFSAIYSLTEDNPEVTYSQVAAKMCVSDELVAGYITNLMEKGVAVKKRYVGRVVKVSLDRRFRDEQAKANLVRLDLPLTGWM